MSPKMIVSQPPGEGRSTRGAKEFELMTPGLARLRKRDRTLESALTTAKSGLPSPSKSPSARSYGPVAAGKSTRGAKELVVSEPAVPMLRRMEIVLAP